MKVDYTALGGGLDLVSGAVSVKPGRASQGLNFEQEFGKQGYRRIDGYERFDGHPEPHKARYFILPFKDGAIKVDVGDTITGIGASAVVVGVEVDSGNWPGEEPCLTTEDDACLTTEVGVLLTTEFQAAVGRLILSIDSGDWVAGTAIYKAGDIVAIASADSYLGRAANSVDHLMYLRGVVNQARSLIGKPPGSGPILGVAVYRDWVVAARDSADGSSATLWKSSGSGWVSIKDGLLPGGRFDFVVANFSGDSQQIALFGVDGRNHPFKWDGGTFTFAAPAFGTQGASATSVAIGTGAKTFTVAGTAKAWQVGDLLTISSKANGANRMSGAIVTYAHPALEINITAVSGSGDHADWEIGQADFEDKPYLVTAHKDHLFLAYPRGQLQSSNLGDPLTFTTSAVLFGVGETITGLASLKGAMLGVFCDNKVHLLEGTSKIDWRLSLHAQNIGTKLYTVQENSGNALMLCSRGVVSLQATQSFGSFEPAIFSRDVKPLLDKKLTRANCTRLTRGKYQYRIYFSDKSVLSACITTPNASVQPQDVAFMPQEYAHEVLCVASGLWAGEDAMFFGTQDGWVMREDVGTSFDGLPIDAVLRLHFNHLRQPVNKKRYHKLTLEMESAGQVDINFRQLFDYSDGFYSAGINRKTLTEGVGGQWGVSDWDEFYWSLPIATQAEANIDGVGRNMALLLWTSSDVDQPIVMQGLILQYSNLGITR